MPLATQEQIQSYLPKDKLDLDDIDDLEEIQAQSERVVKAYLAGVFSPGTLAGWVDESTTPQAVQDISAKICAAFVYRVHLSEDIATIDDESYPGVLYKEAMQMLMDIRSGVIVLEEVDPSEVNSLFELSRLDFWPNDDTIPAAQFSMGMEF